MPEAVGDCFWLDFRPGPSKIVQRAQEIDEDVLVPVDGLDPFAEDETPIMHLEILDDALITWLKREVFNELIKTRRKHKPGSLLSCSAEKT